MEQRELGRSGLRVSAIGIGGATFGREIDAQTAFAVLDRALGRGITLIDTAEAYSAGLSEEIVGRWLAARGARGRVTLATKVSGTLTAERVRSSCEASLRRLGVETVDLFQVHRWDPEVPLEETLGALDALVRAGKVRAVGCSNYAAWQLAKALWRQDARGLARFESVQPVYNLADRRIEQELLPLCADQGLGVITYSPLAAGFLTGKYRRGGDVPPGTRFDVVPAHQELYFTAARFRIMEGLRAIAAEAGLPMAHLALAWVLGRPGVTSVLIGAREPAQVDQGLAAAAALADDIRAALDTLE
jgi:aryl-alcohol dehydrogenase-like predicted oxidoreductase